MAEFIRKKRFLKYKSKECKKFLSKDFIKQCAYCRTREGDLGGPDSFEIDHFKPQELGGSDSYDNLYYICTTCNGKAGKSDTWTPTLLDPCRDDIYDVHIKELSDFKMEDITEQGKEYLSTFKLNRKSYINKRKIIYSNKKELQEKLYVFQNLCRSLDDNGDIDSELRTVLEKDIIDTQNIIEYGANYSACTNCFNEDIDKKIIEELGKIGNCICIDEDYDLFYQLNINGKVFKCHTIVDEIHFDNDRNILRYLEINKIDKWKETEADTPILIIYYNIIDENIYYVKFSDILKKQEGVQNHQRCGYHISIDNVLYKMAI